VGRRGTSSRRSPWPAGGALRRRRRSRAQSRQQPARRGRGRQAKKDETRRLVLIGPPPPPPPAPGPAARHRRPPRAPVPSTWASPPLIVGSRSQNFRLSVWQAPMHVFDRLIVTPGVSVGVSADAVSDARSRHSTSSFMCDRACSQVGATALVAPTGRATRAPRRTRAPPSACQTGHVASATAARPATRAVGLRTLTPGGRAAARLAGLSSAGAPFMTQGIAGPVRARRSTSTPGTQKVRAARQRRLVGRRRCRPRSWCRGARARGSTAMARGRPPRIAASRRSVDRGRPAPQQSVRSRIVPPASRELVDDRAQDRRGSS